MQFEIKILTQDGATYTKSGGLTGQIPPNTLVVLDDPVSVTVNAPAGEVIGSEGVSAPAQ